MAAPGERNFRNSSYREMVLEHLFVGSLLQHLWEKDAPPVELLRSSVDDCGYDIVMECNSVVRHIQLKGSNSKKPVGVNDRIGLKPGGCVICMIFDPETLRFQKFLWLGGEPSKPLPSLKKYRHAKHVRANAKGEKGNRQNTKSVPRGAFTKLPDISTVAQRLFGNIEGTSK